MQVISIKSCTMLMNLPSSCSSSSSSSSSSLSTTASMSRKSLSCCSHVSSQQPGGITLDSPKTLSLVVVRKNGGGGGAENPACSNISRKMWLNTYIKQSHCPHVGCHRCRVPTVARLHVNLLYTSFESSTYTWLLLKTSHSRHWSMSLFGSVHYLKQIFPKV
jgi:hypothetical protein